MSDEADKTASTEGQQNKPHLFQPGQSGNPKGRAKGSRNKLGEDFIQAIHEDFQQFGKETIEVVRKERPQDYLKVVASILPKELNVRVSDFDELSDADINSRILFLARSLSLEIRVGPASPRDAVAEVPQLAEGVQTVQ